jgi:hypothetical protein
MGLSGVNAGGQSQGDTGTDRAQGRCKPLNRIRPDRIIRRLSELLL